MFDFFQRYYENKNLKKNLEQANAKIASLESRLNIAKVELKKKDGLIAYLKQENAMLGSGIEKISDVFLSEIFPNLTKYIHEDIAFLILNSKYEVAYMNSKAEEILGMAYGEPFANFLYGKNSLEKISYGRGRVSVYIKEATGTKLPALLEFHNYCCHVERKGKRHSIHVATCLLVYTDRRFLRGMVKSKLARIKQLLRDLIGGE